MTATSTALTTLHRQSVPFRRVLRASRSTLSAIVGTWGNFVASAQFGRSSEAEISRHAGGRI